MDIFEKKMKVNVRFATCMSLVIYTSVNNLHIYVISVCYVNSDICYFDRGQIYNKSKSSYTNLPQFLNLDRLEKMTVTPARQYTCE